MMLTAMSTASIAVRTDVLPISVPT